MLALQTESLTKIYSGKVNALDNVSLTVETGHVFGLLGPNGAGKTTLVKILLGIVRATAGKATVLEKPLGDTKVKEKIGYLPENHRYPEFLKGGEVLDYYAGLAGVEKHRREANKDRLLRIVNLEKWETTRLKKYSKGMLQRLGLAQAMINDPDILFLDEPTDGVDPIGRKQIRDILHRLQEEGKTIFLNSHLLSEVEMICDQVAILDNGKLVRAGTVEELTSPSKTYRFGVSKISTDVLSSLQEISLSADQDNGAITVTCADLKELNCIIDLLRSHEIEIKSIVPHKQSLEESFIELLQKDAKK